jgi:DNA-binding response OmpR family regulator
VPRSSSSTGLLLLVVDRADLVAELAAELAGHQVEVLRSGEPAEALLQAGILCPDAVLAAADLPSIGVATFVGALSRYSEIPVLVGAGGADGPQAATALAAGATACVARPYRPREVLSILRAIRRAHPNGVPDPLEAGGLRLNPASLEVHLHGRPIRFPLREFRLLQLLMTHADRVVTREQISAEVWRDSKADTTSTVTVHIQRLRARLCDDPHDPSIILTVRGLGYRLVPPPGECPAA